MFQAYAQSRLADSLYALELHRRLTAAHSPAIATSAHPGYAITNLQTSGPGEFRGLVRLLDIVLKSTLSQDAAHGALPSLFAATAPDAIPGGYYGPDGPFELRGYPVAVRIPACAQDRETAERLWTDAERLTSVPFAI